VSRRERLQAWLRGDGRVRLLALVAFAAVLTLGIFLHRLLTGRWR
jgi:hypothetical protein